jgi:hypothetical protein
VRCRGAGTEVQLWGLAARRTWRGESLTAATARQLTRGTGGSARQDNGCVSTAKSWCDVRFGRAQKVIVDFRSRKQPLGSAGTRRTDERFTRQQPQSCWPCVVFVPLTTALAFSEYSKNDIEPLDLIHHSFLNKSSPLILDPVCTNIRQTTTSRPSQLGSTTLFVLDSRRTSPAVLMTSWP